VETTLGALLARRSRSAMADLTEETVLVLTGIAL